MPYKENYSPNYPGAVSLFVDATTKVSKYKKNITIFGNTEFKKKLYGNYKNIELIKNNLLLSQSFVYVKRFIESQKKINSDIIEIHNRPNYINKIKILNKKIVLYFHNDPVTMLGSKTIKERVRLLNDCEKIIFNSEWSKKQFLTNLNNFYQKSEKLEVIHQSINKEKIDLKKKEKLITFVGKLNLAKGYDLFGSAIVKILDKHKDWKANVIGDEPREKLLFKHKNLNLLGFQNNTKFPDKLKILHVTNFNERHNGRLFYNTGKRINNGLIRLGHSVLEFSDRDIVSYYRSLNDLDGSKKLNKKLLEIISNYIPDLIILGHADLIKIETLEYIKKIYPNIKFAQWFLDRMDTLWIANKKRFLNKISIMDANFCTTDPMSLNFKNNYPIYFIPNPVDVSFEKLHNYKKNFFNNDVFFAMSHGVHRGVLKSGKFDNREHFINELLKKTQDVRFDLYGMKNKQPIWADNFIRVISKSKIGLNLSQGKAAKYYSSDRFAQLIGNGLLVMIDENTKFGDFFNKDEIVLYKNIDDLAEKTSKFSNDDRLRKKIAKNGHDKYFKYFNSTIIADFIIHKIFSNNKKRFYWE